jgi:hypothetical protein
MNKNIAEEKNMYELSNDFNKNKFKRKRDLTITSKIILCFNCKKQIPEESSEIKCEGGHVCCNNCFQIAVNVTIRCRGRVVPCVLDECGNVYSEEIVDNNVSYTVGKQLSAFNSSSSSLLPSPFLSPFDKLLSNGPGFSYKLVNIYLFE